MRCRSGARGRDTARPLPPRRCTGGRLLVHLCRYLWAHQRGRPSLDLAVTVGPRGSHMRTRGARRPDHPCQLPQPALRGTSARARRAGCRCRELVSPGLEQLVQDQRSLSAARLRGGIGVQDERRHPRAIPRDVVKAIAGRLPHDRPALLERPGPAVPGRQPGARSWPSCAARSASRSASARSPRLSSVVARLAQASHRRVGCPSSSASRCSRLRASVARSNSPRSSLVTRS
jgi:hypothetical protein